MPAQFGNTERIAAERLIALAFEEDLHTTGDRTTSTLIAESQTGTVQIVSRGAGIVCGLPLMELIFQGQPQVSIRTLLADGSAVTPGSVIAEITGPLRALLTCERTVLNFINHLSGVASLTRRFVDAAAGTEAGIFDTRKTLPGWRVLEKYAVRSGGGRNHRMGLFDMVLIKDNHLAAWAASGGRRSIAEAIQAARARNPGIPIEVEVDTLEQLREALPGAPEMVLLDNMSCDQLREAVQFRNATAPGVELEASGGVNLETVADIARTGVERISVGALTQSAPALDLGFDWK